MTVPAQGSIFSFAQQIAKVGDGGTFDSAALTWYKVRTGQNSVGPIQDQQSFPLETGGPLTPTDEYKQLSAFGGQVELIPRLEDTMGYIFKAALGAVSSTSGKTADGVALVGVNTHIFRFNPTLPADQPWMAFRRTVPGTVLADQDGETGFDCKIGSVRVNIPAMGKVSMALALQGRDYIFDNGSTWVYGNANFETGKSSPDAGRGSIKVGGVAYPIMGLSLDIVNSLSSLTQEMIVGSFNPDDFIALSRMVAVRFVYKWKDAKLNRKIFTGLDAGTKFNSLPFLVDKDASGYAFEGIFQSPGLIGATAQPYEMRIRAGRVTIAADGPVNIQPGSFVTQAFTLKFLEPAAGEDYIQIAVVNGKAGYP